MCISQTTHCMENNLTGPLQELSSRLEVLNQALLPQKKPSTISYKKRR